MDLVYAEFLFRNPQVLLIIRKYLYGVYQMEEFYEKGTPSLLLTQCLCERA